MEGHFTELAAKIAELGSAIDRRLSALDQKISELRPDMNIKFTESRSYVDQHFAHIEGTLPLHNWMLGTILTFLVALFFKELSR